MVNFEANYGVKPIKILLAVQDWCPKKERNKKERVWGQTRCQDTVDRSRTEYFLIDLA